MIPLHVLVGMSCIAAGCIIILITLVIFLKKRITTRNYDTIETNQTTKQNIAELMSDKTKVEHLMVLKTIIYIIDNSSFDTHSGVSLKHRIYDIYLHNISYDRLAEIERDLIRYVLIQCYTSTGRILTSGDLETFTGVVYHRLINERYIRKMLAEYAPDPADQKK
jgi:hypothetical protein